MILLRSRHAVHTMAYRLCWIKYEKMAPSLNFVAPPSVGPWLRGCSKMLTKKKYLATGGGPLSGGGPGRAPMWPMPKSGPDHAYMFFLTF